MSSPYTSKSWLKASPFFFVLIAYFTIIGTQAVQLSQNLRQIPALFIIPNSPWSCIKENVWKSWLDFWILKKNFETTYIFQLVQYWTSRFQKMLNVIKLIWHYLFSSSFKSQFPQIFHSFFVAKITTHLNKFGHIALVRNHVNLYFVNNTNINKTITGK